MKKSFWSKFPGVNSYKSLCAWPLLDLHLPSHSALSPSLIRLLLAHWVPRPRHASPGCTCCLGVRPHLSLPSGFRSPLRVSLRPLRLGTLSWHRRAGVSPAPPHAAGTGATPCCNCFFSCFPSWADFLFFESSNYVLCLRMSWIRDSELETVSDF